MPSSASAIFSVIVAWQWSYRRGACETVAEYIAAPFYRRGAGATEPKYIAALTVLIAEWNCGSLTDEMLHDKLVSKMTNPC